MKNAIKKTVVIVVIMFSALTTYAQTKKADLSYVATIPVSADKVWEQIRVMDNIDNLSSFVGEVKWTGPKGEGGCRVCTAPDGKSHYKENIVAFSDSKRMYTYQVVEGVPAKNMINSFKVVDLGLNESMIVWTSNYEFMKNPNMTKEQFEAFLRKAIDELINNTVQLAM